MTKLILTAVFAFSLSLFLSAQSVIWNDIPDPKRESQQIFPESFRTVTVDFESLKLLLLAAPAEGTDLRNSNFIISLPTPDGGRTGFKIIEESTMAPELQTRYPEIRTYIGIGTGEYAAAKVNLDFTLHGFHAQVLIDGKSYYIDPLSPADLNTYIVYSRESFFKSNPKAMHSCEVDDIGVPQPGNRTVVPGNGQKSADGIEIEFPNVSNGTELRTYDLALACTGEYAQFHGGTVPLVLSAMTTTMNRVNGIYRSDVCLRMLLIADNDDLIFLDPVTDGYSNNDGVAMLGQNQTKIDLIIGSSNYDIGHVFSTGGGGVATLGVVCNNSTKARGVTGLSSPIGDPFDVDYVAHEMGHQWNAPHTFNNSCSGNRSSSSAYEPGSGSTIMAYAGICAPNLQSNSDPYFHNKSYNDIVAYSVTGGGNSCATISSAINSPPVITIPSGGFSIPKSTPFELTGSATDPNLDPMTFCWEQFDLGPATDSGDNDLTDPSGDAPIFRSWEPSSSPTRVFPRLDDLVNNTTVLGEHLPTYARDLTFKLTVRDGYINGAVNDAQLAFDVAGNSGPFVVTSPNTAVSWIVGANQTVTWNVANTTASPVSCNLVNIYLSTDGGFTYPTLLAANTPNDGTQSIVVPDIPTSQGRIKVKAVGNVFFDISNQNFSILENIAPPSNDEICSAIVINCGNSLAGTSVNATPSSLGQPSCTDGTENDVFYRFNAIEGNTYTITVNGGNYDGVLALYSGPSCAATLTEIACADQGFSPGIAETITFTATENTPIFIQTYDWSITEGEFIISLECEFINDDPCDAITLTCGQTVNGSTVGATPSAVGIPSCGSGTLQDVFYKIEAIGGVDYTVTVNGINYDGILAAYTGSCSGTLTELDCSDVGIANNLIETIEFSVPSDQTVYIQTYDWSSTGGEFALEVLCSNVPYDEPCEARNLTCGESFSGSTAGATLSIGNPTCALGSQEDVFFKFTALANTPYSVTVNGGNYDGVLAAYSGSCTGALTQLDCSDSGFANGIAETVNINVPTTQEILIQTYDYFASGPSDFTITLNCPIPDNDDCADAISLSVNEPGDCPANQIEGTTYGATASDPDACEPGSPDVYFTFNSGSNSEVVINLDAIAATDLVLSVFAANCSSTAIFCEIGTNLSSVIEVIPSTTYYVRVHSWTEVFTGTFNLCVEEVYDCPDLNANFGDSCNDGNPNTTNDIIQSDCTCEGTPVAEGTLSGTITGWSATCAERPVVGSIANFSTGNVYNNLPGILHSNGTFTLDGSPSIIPGTYSVLVKVAGALAVRVDGVVINSGANTMTVPPVVLGDLNGDNLINIFDISQFTVSFGTSIGHPNYSILADFNCDGTVNIFDISSLNLGFGQSGDGFIL